MKRLSAVVMMAALAAPVLAHESSGIGSDKSTQVEAAFDLVHTRVSRDGDLLVFEQVVEGSACGGCG